MEAHAAAGNLAGAVRSTSSAAGSWPTSLVPIRRRRPRRSTARSGGTPALGSSAAAGRRACREPEPSQIQTALQALRAKKVTERPSRKRRAVLFSALSGVILAQWGRPLVVFGHGGRGGRSAVSAVGDSLRVVRRVASSRTSSIAQHPRPPSAKGRTGSRTPTVTRCRGSTPARTPSCRRLRSATARAGIATVPLRLGGQRLPQRHGLADRPGLNTVVDTITVEGRPLGIVYAAG